MVSGEPLALTRTIIAVTGLGASVDIEPVGNRSQHLRDTLTPLWARCAPASPQHPSATVTVDLSESGAAISRGTNALEGSDERLLIERTTQAVTLALIKAQAGRMLMLHAGAVSNPTSGRSLVYAAESQTGKTTLTMTLARSYGYLTDETVAIDESLRIWPYPKPLSVRSDHAPRREIAPDELGLLPTPPRPTLGRLVILHRDPTLTAPHVEELDLFDAIIALAPQTSSLGLLDRGLSRISSIVERTGPVLRIRYAEAPSLLPITAGLIGAPA